MKFVELWSQRVKKEILNNPTTAAVAIIFILVLILVAIVHYSFQSNNDEKYPYIIGSEYPEETIPLYTLEGFFNELMLLKMPFLFWVFVGIAILVILR